MKTTASLLSGILALLLPVSIFAAPKPTVNPPRIRVTLQALEIPAGTAPVTVSDTIPASEVYKSLLLNDGTEATEISVQTPADFPGTAQYSRVFAYTATENGKPSLNLLTAPTTLEAMPHVNPDGTITVRLNMEITSFVSSALTLGHAVPETTSQRMTTTRTFTSGKTILFNATLQTAPSGNTGKGTESKELLQFVTVTILPNEKTAAR